MKKFKKIVALITASLMALTSLSLTVLADENNTDFVNNAIESSTIHTQMEKMSDSVLAASSTIMSLNTFYTKSLSAGSEHTYYFTPSVSGLYTVETFGSTDTYGSVHCISPSGNFYDDYSGSGNNFAIGFRQNANNQVSITVRHSNQTSGTGTYQIQVRKQKAQIYTFQYDDISTIGDEISPSSSLSTMGYNVNSYQNKASSHILGTPISPFPRINSEVIFYAGHGNPGNLVFYNGSSYSYLYPSDMTSMSNTKVAVWAACYSTVAPSGGVSIAQRSINLGAKSAIGWNTVLGNTAGRIWTDKFFQELANGDTVNNAASTAGASFLWPWEGSFSGWSVLGDGSVRIIYPTVNPKLSVENPEIVADFENLISSGTYKEYELKGKGMRYYKTINGCLTNDFYDVTIDGTITKSKATISDEEIEEIQNIDVETMYKKFDAVNVFDNVIAQNDYLVYVKYEEQLIPVKLIYMTYKSVNGFDNQNVTCINLLNNTEIDYTDVCVIK